MFDFNNSLKTSIILITIFSSTSSFSDITELTEPSIDAGIDKKLRQLNTKIKSTNTSATLYTSRGHVYFRMRDFQNAIDDYTSAISLDPKNYDAYFGRGLANGRLGFIKEGIKDLSVYITQYPDSSLAYTKRGVRYLWLNESQKAQHDFEMALELNPNNAEAHDDLGVIFAQQKKYKQAITHFNLTIKLDPTYQKGFHNLAMSYYLIGQDILALQNVNIALRLSPNSRSSMLLKSEILIAVGNIQDAMKLREDAEFLPAGNWHEQAPIN